MTFTLDQVLYDKPLCINQPLPTNQISLKLRKKTVDRPMYVWMDIARPVLVGQNGVDIITDE